MKVLGMVTGFPPGSHGRPVVSCVLLEGFRASPTVLDAFELRTPADDLVDQLQDLARALASKISGLEIDAFVIRLADRAPQANQTTAPRRRLLIEGALALRCREQTAQVSARTGRELAMDAGMLKADLIALGRKIDAGRKDAAAAAISALA
jgi:hypothetical protein